MDLVREPPVIGLGEIISASNMFHHFAREVLEPNHPLFMPDLFIFVHFFTPSGLNICHLRVFDEKDDENAH